MSTPSNGAGGHRLAQLAKSEAYASHSGGAHAAVHVLLALEATL